MCTRGASSPATRDELSTRLSGGGASNGHVVWPLSPGKSLKRLISAHPVGGSALVRDYLHEVPSALSYFGGSPYRLPSYRQKLDEVTRRFGPKEREAAARALTPTSDAARLRLERFVEEGGAMVTTGQQAGFLTGPLYTIYKAVSAVVLARHLERTLDTLVIPVFWIASDDHDWAEVNHAILLDPKNRTRRFALSSADDRPLPMSERRLEGELDELCDHVSEVVAPNKNTLDWVKRIIDPYRQDGVTVASAFGAAIHHLLAPFDVCIADSASAAVKHTTAPLIRRALTEADEQEVRLAARTTAIVESGYDAQVAVLAGGTNVFRSGEAGRERLYRRGTDFAVRERKVRLPREQILAEVEADPGSFSPNVFLRPVVESAAFPTLAYVGGPGEIAYFAQANALFEANGIAPPVVVPRFSGLVVERKVEKLLTSLDLELADALESRDALIDRLARREVPDEVTDLLSTLRDDLVRDFDGILSEVESLDATLVGAMGSIRNRTLLIAERAERKVVRAIKKGDGIALAKLDRVLDSLRPGGSPQDRVLNVLPFLARYGDHFLIEIERAILEDWRLPSDG